MARSLGPCFDQGLRRVNGLVVMVKPAGADGEPSVAGSMVSRRTDEQVKIFVVP